MTTPRRPASTPREVPLRHGTVLSIQNVPTTPGAHPAGPPPYYRWRKGSSNPEEDLKRVHAIAATMGVALIEVISGKRSIGQLGRWVHPSVLEKISYRMSLETRPPHPVDPRACLAAKFEVQHLRPQRVRAIRVGLDEYEASVVVHNGTRARAVALRIHKPVGQWLVTAAEIG